MRGIRSYSQWSRFNLFIACSDIWPPPAAFQSPPHNGGVESTAVLACHEHAEVVPCIYFFAGHLPTQVDFPVKWILQPPLARLSGHACGDWCLVRTCCPASVQPKGCCRGCLQHKVHTEGPLHPNEYLGKHPPVVVCMVCFPCRFPLILQKF